MRGVSVILRAATMPSTLMTAEPTTTPAGCSSSPHSPHHLRVAFLSLSVCEQYTRTVYKSLTTPPYFDWFLSH
ncbi:hypothetical protein EDB83DRAFT_1206003 [Lactarius deliciosus]|nr:hypothetical protein EDB83DRAFT_1206003 [Lactarius deliciosus]